MTNSNPPKSLPPLIQDNHEHVLICPDCDKTPTELGYILPSKGIQDNVEKQLNTVLETFAGHWYATKLGDSSFDLVYEEAISAMLGIVTAARIDELQYLEHAREAATDSSDMFITQYITKRCKALTTRKDKA
ncbi:MAG: hypothetical protein QFB87_04640 [Patescibacteria group bacterium]|nr:hypothetical protein [Patescibacteria group bacterium]